MAPKDMAKKVAAQITRYPISDSSLVYVPEDAVEGFQDRIETGIDWTMIEMALRHHRKRYFDGKEFPPIGFTESLEKKISKSYFNGFVKDSNISLQDQWEVVLASELWDTEKFGNEEMKICFESANSFTDDVLKLVKEAVRLNDRKFLEDRLKKVDLLRLNDAKITHLDIGTLQFKYLVSLSLCGNCLETIDGTLIPPTLRSLELGLNYISNVEAFVDTLPTNLIYLGLSKNLLTSDNLGGFSKLPFNLQVLDLSDNNILELFSLMECLGRLPNLNSLILSGNPCSVSAAYSRLVLISLPQLKWLDFRRVLPMDRFGDYTDISEIHPDDVRSSTFFFTVFRIIGVIQPPKTEKGATTAFHVELEIPLLDSVRRQFLMFRSNESLIEMLPAPEGYYDENAPSHSNIGFSRSIMTKNPEEASTHDFDIYMNLETKNPLEIHNFTTYESNKVQWNKIMNFQEPTIKIFCPDLVALRNTFRTTITLRLVYTMVVTVKAAKGEKNPHSMLGPPEQRVVLAEIRCGLKNPDWTQHSQHFHWDDSLGTNEAIHWGDGDLSVLQYAQVAQKPVKGKPDDVGLSSRQTIPDNLTCHFGFGIETR